MKMRGQDMAEGASGGIAGAALALAVVLAAVFAAPPRATAATDAVEKYCGEKHYWSRQSRQECVEREQRALRNLNRPINPRIKAYCFEEVGGSPSEIERCVRETETFRR